jgi:4-amino-4-deoxy-L-arabinose transferase-like glycosyltransferase
MAIVVRFFSFFPSLIDHDESTYLEIARMILTGKTLYVDMIDIKPPGIFLILAGFQFLFGYSIFVMRLLVTLWIAVTAFVIYKTTRLLVKDERASVASGIIYIFFISTWKTYGISITPEIFFNLFTISALYVLLNKQSLLNYLAAGLIAGIGFIVKYFVIFDFAAFMVFLVILNFRRKEKLNYLRQAFSFLLAGVGFFLPFALTNLWFFLNGHFSAFYDIVYLAPARYPAAFDPRIVLKIFFDFHIYFFPVFIFFYDVLINKKSAGPEIPILKILGIIWALMALIVVMISGMPFGHYTIQLMLPVSLVAGAFFHSERSFPFIAKPLNRRTLQIITAGLILLLFIIKFDYFTKRDIPREIATYMEPRLKPGDVIYTGNYQQIIYYLLKKDSPTKYIHRTLLLYRNHLEELDINADEEFRYIMAQSPVYIVTEKDYPAGIMKDFINKNYTVEKDFGKGIVVLRANKRS